MRVVPLLSCSESPTRWREHTAVELRLDGGPTAPWIGAVASGLEVHALHAPAGTWVPNPGSLLVTGLAPDFLVLPTEIPTDRAGTTALLGALELLLTVSAGPRIALRPRPGEARALARLLDDVQGHAIGFCWDPSLDHELEALQDRLLTAVAAPHASLAELARLGYRWNVALPASDPEAFRNERDTLNRPEPELPLPGAVLPEVSLRWGAAWGETP